MTTTFYPATEDVKVIAKHLRGLIKNVPGAVYSVSINRQWAKLKEGAKEVIYIEGMVKLWGDDYTPEKQKRSELQLQGIIKDIAEEYQLEIVEGLMRWILVQNH